MNRIDKLFSEKKGNILSIYFTAGYPAQNDTLRIIKSLDQYGADMIEIGMPFSDPVADGPVIQESSQVAIYNGMTLDLLFVQLKSLREITEMPVILMGYLNPVYRMGMDLFLEKCKKAGVDGVIIPDLPLEVYRDEYRKDFEKAGIRNILLITPQTTDDRIREIDSMSGGFLYLVSSYSTTGRTGSFSKKQIDYFSRIRGMKLKNPGVIGFGISDREGFKTACRFASGGIIGSAFIRAINERGPMDEKIEKFFRDYER